MAKKLFQPGNPGGPGRPPTPDDIKDIRKYSALEVERVFDKFLHLSKVELLERIKSPDAPALEAILGQVILKAISGGDHVRLNFILERLVGKVKEVVDVNVRKPYMIERLDGSVVELGSKEEERE